ncbi:uncharacterized protein LOC143363386 [Halictus rubicundus]|uniref:uncharacterized protein LOC143363386 n=1 Tax=Halictus rubicundus TaxID=77578 RepID=UPI004036F238
MSALKVKSLIKVRGVNKLDSDALETRKIKLEEYYQAFLKVQSEIEDLAEEAQLEADQDLEREQFDDLYYEYADLLSQRIREVKSNDSMPQANVHQTTKLPEINKDSPLGLRTLKESALRHVNALKALRVPVDTWDAILTYLVIQKLDKATRRAWERTLENAQMPTFNIDALIGTTIFYKLLSTGQIKLANNSDAVLQKTLLGWIVAGEVGSPEKITTLKSCQLVRLEQQITRFWEVEEVPTKKHLSSEEQACEALYCNSTLRGGDGRYIVRLPFNEQKENLGNSYDMALRRFYSLERKLAKNRELKREYSEFLREYNDLGHMTEITSYDNKSKGYYIPHHAVIKEANLSTKVRVVFDASAKNAAFQKILWRNSEHDALQIFKLTTVTQGTASAPFLATRTLQQLADDESKDFPLAAAILKNDMYVDDLLTGTSSVDTAELWKANLNWDETIPQSLQNKWTSLKEELPSLSAFNVKRQITLPDAIDYQLHGFYDASEQAYGACIYLRSINKGSNCSVKLICAKSRVAPVKTISVPRLELCAAQLLAKLVTIIPEALQIKFNKIYLWSDSTITLHWIKSSPHTLKTFVANRVAEIQAKSYINDWYHVATDDNPADYISRGQDPAEFVSNSHWLHGPTWLSQDESKWKIKELLSITVPDQRVTTTLISTGEARDSSGLDYCGPFLLKEKKFRNKGKVKSYVAVFVCFATRAVHMELVTDLTSETCLEAIRRFCARRGKPMHIYSDNATNFVGVKNEMVQIRAFFMSEENQNTLSRSLLTEEINWHFIPPRSPHFGGLWEAAVKSFKQHLYRTVGDAMFPYEQFNTFIVEIESILNSRPLTPISCDPNDLTALTPAHFLIGGSLKNIPEIDLRDVATNRLSMWQHIHKVKHHFWQRWHKEYLNELRTRSKWHQGDGTKITVGQMVTVKEDNLPPMHWSIGRITAVHPGTDNIVRVATVKTSSGVYKRGVNKLAPLPIDIPIDSATPTD